MSVASPSPAPSPAVLDMASLPADPLVANAQWLAQHAVAVWALACLLSGLGLLAWRAWSKRRPPAPRPTHFAARAWRRLRWALPALAGFAGLASQIQPGQALQRFDTALAQALADTVDRGTLQAFGALSWLGNPAPVSVLTAAVALALLWRGQRWWAAGWLLGVLGNTLLNWSVKQVFARPRPPHEHGVVLETGYSFPSGHASGMWVTYGLLAWLLCQVCPPRWHGWILVATATLVLSGPVSRVMLQVHYASDVLAGLCSGSVWLLVCLLWMDARPAAAVAPATTAVGPR